MEAHLAAEARRLAAAIEAGEGVASGRAATPAAAVQGAQGAGGGAGGPGGRAGGAGNGAGGRRGAARRRRRGNESAVAAGSTAAAAKGVDKGHLRALVASARRAVARQYLMGHACDLPRKWLRTRGSGLG